MSSLVERLVESWLDNQTERRYQSAFVQMLLSEGWAVLHNTRHSPIEFGKDIIARDSLGKLYCFQLKGNPASRVTKSEAQNLLPQVIELLEVDVPRHFKTDEQERYISVFVTNGEVDEEARVLFELTARRTERGLCPSDGLQIWSRGQLLAKFIKRAGFVWPATLEGTQLILEVFGGNGAECPDPKRISKLFQSAAPLGEARSNPAKDSAISCLFLLCEIVKSCWYKAENHYGLYSTTIICCVYALQIAGNDKTRIGMVREYAEVCFAHCEDLLREAKQRQFDPDKAWAEQDPLAEVDIMVERRRLIADMLAGYVLGRPRCKRIDTDMTAHVLTSSYRNERIWGQGMVPSIILRYWAMCQVSASSESEQILGSRLAALCAANARKSGDVKPLSGPYYNFFDVWAEKNNIMFIANDRIREDNSLHLVWFARAMLFMLAKRNYKKTCRSIWSIFSRCIHQEPRLPDKSFFTAELCAEGSMEQFTYRAESWVNLVSQAVDGAETKFLTPYSDLAWLIAAYVAIVPYRASTNVVMWLDGELSQTFYNKSFLPN